MLQWQKQFFMLTFLKEQVMLQVYVNHFHVWFGRHRFHLKFYTTVIYYKNSCNVVCQRKSARPSFPKVAAKKNRHRVRNSYFEFVGNRKRPTWMAVLPHHHFTREKIKRGLIIYLFIYLFIYMHIFVYLYIYTRYTFFFGGAAQALWQSKNNH